jgi:hypothetical protein
LTSLGGVGYGSNEYGFGVVVVVVAGAVVVVCARCGGDASVFDAPHEASASTGARTQGTATTRTRASDR